MQIGLCSFYTVFHNVAIWIFEFVFFHIFLLDYLKCSYCINAYSKHFFKADLFSGKRVIIIFILFLKVLLNATLLPVLSITITVIITPTAIIIVFLF